MYSLVAVAFIVGAAGSGFYLSQRPTVARGEVLAETVHGIDLYTGAKTITCDDEVPITVDGADFSCTGDDGDGTTAAIACSLKPNGQMSCKTTTQSRQRKAKTGDVWK